MELHGILLTNEGSIRKDKVLQRRVDMDRAPQSDELFPVEPEYTRCVSDLNRTDILELLPKSGSMGVIGFDGKEYPIPTLEQVIGLFDHNCELVSRKMAQGFDRLEISPLAIPTAHLIGLLKTMIRKYGEEGKIYQTRHSSFEPLIPVRVNDEKQVWIWETMRMILDTDKMVYFPQEYSDNMRGQIKLEVILNGNICGLPGWSVGLVESLPIVPQQGLGKTIGGRKQLELGFSPREFMQTLQTEAYKGETGKTLEDFLTEFLIRLETIHEVSHDMNDNNALWCLGQYFEVPYAKLVPTGRWFRDVGRVRLDAHRTGNRQCTKSWGVTTVVRLAWV